MKYAFCLEMLYTNLPFIKRLEESKIDGINTIEFWDWRDKDLNDLKKQMQHLKMSVSNMSGNRNFGMIDVTEKERFLKEVKDTGKIAKELGCPRLMLLVQKLEGVENRGKLPANAMSLSEMEKNIIESGNEAGKIADELDLDIVIEPLNDVLDHPDYVLKNSEMAFRIIKAINHPRVKLLYDIYHMAMQGENVQNDLENNLDLIGYLHIADKPGRNEPGTGEIDYPGILALLKKINYQGFVGFEFMPKEDNTKRAIGSIMELIG